MTKSQLVAKIREMPINDQRDLAETILSNIGVPEISSERTAYRLQMEEAAAKALEYYRTDPDVALWRELEGEPIDE